MTGSGESQSEQPAELRESHWVRVRRLLAHPVDASSLAAFRILFAVLMMRETVRFYPRVATRYLASTFHFTYDFAPFVRPWTESGFQLHFALMFLAAAGIALGLMYRVSCALFLFCYTYVFLIDRVGYNNHYYLCVLLAFLFLVVPANAMWSVDARYKPATASPVVPFWSIAVFRAQLFIVYFYAGLAKLNADWLRAEPISDMLKDSAEVPVLGTLLAYPFAPYVIGYVGLVFDLSIGFLLLSRRTRLFALPLLFCFHFINNLIFSIGIFPFLGICSVIVFFDAGMPRRAVGICARALGGKHSQAAPLSGNRQFSVPMTFLAIYFALQLTIPFRHLLYPGDASWTEEGHGFSWHMKLRTKECNFLPLIFDGDHPERGYTWPTLARGELTAQQRWKMCRRPQLVHQYVQHLKQLYIASGMRNPIIRAEYIASLNGRPFQYVVDPATDLGSVEYSWWKPDDWIVPLKPGVPGTVYPKSSREKSEQLDQVRAASGDPFNFLKGRNPGRILSEPEGIDLES